MGGELKRILDGQRQLEEQFNQLTLDEESSGVQQLRDHAHSINATTQGIYTGTPYKDHTPKVLTLEPLIKTTPPMYLHWNPL